MVRGSALSSGAEPRNHTDLFDSPTRRVSNRAFNLTVRLRPFTIDEYLCIMMDKYASTKEIEWNIGKPGDRGDWKKI